MPSRRSLTPLLGCAALVAALAGCGAAQSGSSAISGSTLTIYSSLPHRGIDADTSRDLEDAERLALHQAGGRVGKYAIRYVALDSASPVSGVSDPSTVSANTRRAAADTTTIAVLGGGSSASSAVSIPILNEAGILEVSPRSTAVELTRSTPSVPGAPSKYYPAASSNGRTFGRVVPQDTFQAAAQLDYMRRRRVRKLFILTDGGLDGQSVAALLRSQAKAKGIAVADQQAIDPRAKAFPSIELAVRGSGAQAVFYGGLAPSAVPLFRALNAADPRLELYATANLAQDGFAAALPPAVRGQTFLTSPAPGPGALPAAGKKFVADFRAATGRPPQPSAIFGYEAMAVVLDAIRRAGNDGNRRKDVMKAFLATRDRPSVVGTYSIDADGDTSFAGYGGYVVKDGQVVFSTALSVR